MRVHFSQIILIVLLPLSLSKRTAIDEFIDERAPYNIRGRPVLLLLSFSSFAWLNN